MPRPSSSRLLLEGLLAGFLPPAAVMGGLIAVFGVTKSRGHGGGGIDLFYYMVVAFLVWLVGLVLVSAWRPERVAGVLPAFGRGAMLGSGALLVFGAVHLGWGANLYIDDFAQLAEEILLPALAVMTVVGIVSLSIWAFAHRSIEPERGGGFESGSLWSTGTTVFVGLVLAAVALGVLVLLVATWSRLGEGAISGPWIAPVCLVPAAGVLWVGVLAGHARLGDRSRARLFGASYGASGALVFLVWYGIETGAGEPWAFALVVLGCALVAAVLAFLSGFLWSRRAHQLRVRD